MTSTGQATISGRHRETGSIRDRSPGHHELRAYSAPTGRQVTRTLLAPRSEKGSGTRAARAELAKPVPEAPQGLRQPVRLSPRHREHWPGRRPVPDAI